MALGDERCVRKSEDADDRDGRRSNETGTLSSDSIYESDFITWTN